MIPVYLKTADFEQPAEPLYYLVAANGVFLVKDAGLFASVTKAENVAGLESVVPAFTLRMPKVPRDLMEKVYGFFDVVYRQWDGEAVAFLYYSSDGERFHVDVPPQTLFRYRTHSGWRTQGRLEYGPLPRPEGFLWLGDIHSHGDSRAFFSGTDDRDDGQDGLRIVMGRLNRDIFEICVSFVTGGTRFELAPEDILEEFSRPLPAPSEWLQRISFRCNGGKGLDRQRSWNEPAPYK